MENSTFNFDTDDYIVEPSEFSYNELIVRGLGSIYKAGKTPRDF